MLGVSGVFLWSACSVKRLQNKHHYAGECWGTLQFESMLGGCVGSSAGLHAN